VREELLPKDGLTTTLLLLPSLPASVLGTTDRLPFG
jgi:hypothetical protein